MKFANPGDVSFTRRSWLRSVALASAAVACPLPGAAAGKRAKPTGLDEPQQAALRGVINEAISKKLIPGASLLVLSRGDVVFREAFGHTEFEEERAFTPELPCFIASLSKPITATYFASLDERGVISLDDPVEKFLPEFKGIRVQEKGPAVTKLRVWHLLSHRSGLPGNADMGDERPQWLARAAGADPGAAAAAPGGVSLKQVIDGWIQESLRAEPGERFAYGSSGYMVAARIAEVVMGKRFERLLEEGLLDPVGMKATTFHPDAETMRRVPARYVSTPNGTRREPRAMPLPAEGGLINPAGGLCSRLDDLAAFLALHLNRGIAGEKRLLKPESLARMYRPHPPRATEAADGGGQGYGLGWNVMAPGGFVRHLGGSGTLAWLDLRREHAGVLLTQVKWGPTRAIIPRLIKEVQAIFPEGGN
jgi:CubicO group peptidase (beta-lactamase class C family)